LTQSAKGYIVADWDWTVQKKLQSRATFVVGADGHGSLVRTRLGIEYERLADPELFTVCEFETEGEPGNEVRIVVDEATTNVLWPLPGNCCRWSFQLVKTKEAGEFPDKEREAVQIVQAEVDENTRSHVERLAQKRAPWFGGKVKDVYWWAHIRFQHRLAKRFGEGRGWLAGDAAHQTGPIGVQSMNEGLREAVDLAGKLKQILRDGASPELLESYHNAHRNKWEKLLGLKGAPSAKTPANPWAKDHWAKILSCIPATGEDLTHLAGQLGLDF